MTFLLGCVGCQNDQAYGGRDVGTEDAGAGRDTFAPRRDTGTPDVLAPCVDVCALGVTECVSDLSYRTCGLEGGCTAWHALEHCDEQCLDGRCTEGCVDFDQDGRGERCPAGPDCDDRNPFRYPGNPEICDGHDNDCDDRVDEGGVCDEPCPEPGCTPGVLRCDGDGIQICTTDLRDCPLWSGTRPCPQGLTCDGGVCSQVVECVDRDGDGFGRGCDAGDDCDDSDRSQRPGVAEVCNGRDDDCNGRLDDACSGQVCAGAGAVVLQEGVPWSGQKCAPTTFRIEAPSGGLALVSAAFVDDMDGELTLNLRRNGLLASASGHAAGVEFTLAAGAYNVEVTGANNRAVAVGWTYVTPRCDDDTGEPNNAPGSTATLFPGRAHRGALCQGDLDFFVPVRPRQWIVDADLVHEDPSTLLEIWHNGAAVTPDQRRGDNLRHAHLRTNLSGDYALAVRGGRPTVEGSYILTMSARPIPRCTDDPQENNDRLDRAAVARGTVRGVVCPGDTDWYEIGRYNEGASINASIAFDAAAANLDAWLFVGDLNGLAQVALTDRSPEVLPTGAPRTGTYYVLIQGRSAYDTADYTLTVR